MKQKDMYTLEELYTNLGISLSKLSKIAGVTEPTLTRIRDGYSARRETVNRLLEAFSEVYGLELSLDNVTGITLEDKKAIRQQMLKRKGITEKPEKPPVPSPVVQTTSPVTEKPGKRVYNRKQDTGLPDGCMLATDFARQHGIASTTFRDHMLIGLGEGVPWGMGNEIIVEKDHADYSERPKPGRTKEKEKYLTQDQQKAALQFWQRHNVAFSQCNDFGCWCHTLKNL